MAKSNKVKNAKQHAKGELKVAVGKATGNEKLQDEGKKDQSVANLKQAAEKVKDALKK